MQFRPQTVLVVAVVFLGTLSALAEDFYVWRRGTPRTTMQRYKNGDPESVKVEEWQILLNKKNRGGYWGIITGNTIESVQRQLEEGQRFERFWVKWAEIEEDPYSYFYPFGPIAVLSDTSGGNDGLDERLLTANHVFRLLDQFSHARETVKAIDKAETQRDFVANLASLSVEQRKAANAFKEYVNLLKSIRDKAAAGGPSIELGGATGDRLAEMKQVNAIERAEACLRQIKIAPNDQPSKTIVTEQSKTDESGLPQCMVSGQLPWWMHQTNCPLYRRHVQQAGIDIQLRVGNRSDRESLAGVKVHIFWQRRGDQQEMVASGTLDARGSAVLKIPLISNRDNPLVYVEIGDKSDLVRSVPFKCEDAPLSVEMEYMGFNPRWKNITERKYSSLR